MNWWVKQGSISGPTLNKKHNEWVVSWVQQWASGTEIKLSDDFVLHSFALKFIRQLRKREKDASSGVTTDCH
jgi:hypothetical protein